MSLQSWSEASLCRNIRRLDPFQRGMQTTLAQSAHAVRFYTAIDGAIERALAAPDRDYASACERNSGESV